MRILGLAGLAVLMLLGLLAMPVVLHIRKSLQRIDMLANGRYIVPAAYGANYPLTSDGQRFGRAHGAPRPVPLPRDEATTAEYFTKLVVEGHFPVERKVFSGPGLRPDTGPITYAQPLRSEENAWRIVAGLDAETTPNSTPFLLSRNLVQKTLGDPPKLADVPPFGLEGAVVWTFNGGGSFIRAGDLEEVWAELVPEDLRHLPILPP